MQDFLISHGLGLAAFGAAYLFLLANAAGTAICYGLVRRYLIISPNRAAGHYGLYVSVVLVSLLIATMLDNMVLTSHAPTLQFAAFPQIVLLLIVHVLIYRRQEPRLIALGASSIASAILIVLPTSLLTDDIDIAHWITAAILACLLAFLWIKSISTQHGFASAKSIYIDSKEGVATAAAAQRPWLGLTHWVGLVCASLALATVNALLVGDRLADLPALTVLLGSAELLGATLLVVAVPAATYWFARKDWMPELTRFVWLVWLVVGFSFSYTNYLQSLQT